MVYLDLEKRAKEEAIAEYFDFLRKKASIRKETKGSDGVTALEDNLTREERLTLDGVTALEEECKGYKEELRRYKAYFELLNSLLPKSYNGPLA